MVVHIWSPNCAERPISHRASQCRSGSSGNKVQSGVSSPYFLTLAICRGGSVHPPIFAGFRSRSMPFWSPMVHGRNRLWRPSQNLTTPPKHFRGKINRPTAAPSQPAVRQAYHQTSTLANILRACGVWSNPMCVVSPERLRRLRLVVKSTTLEQTSKVRI